MHRHTKHLIQNNNQTIGPVWAMHMIMEDRPGSQVRGRRALSEYCEIVLLPSSLKDLGRVGYSVFFGEGTAGIVFRGSCI